MDWEMPRGRGTMLSIWAQTSQHGHLEASLCHCYYFWNVNVFYLIYVHTLTLFLSLAFSAPAWRKLVLSVSCVSLPRNIRGDVFLEFQEPGCLPWKECSLSSVWERLFSPSLPTQCIVRLFPLSVLLAESCFPQHSFSLHFFNYSTV